MTVNQDLYALTRDDYNGPSAFFRPLASHVDAMVVTTTEDYTVPAECNKIILSADGDFYAKKGGTAAIPGTEVSDGSGSELNPVCLQVSPGDVIGFIASVSTVITISCFK